MQGCGYKGYLWQWWWTPLRNSLKRYRPVQILPLCPAKRWYKLALGRAGKDTVLMFCTKLGKRRVVAKPNAIHNMWTFPVYVVLDRFHVFELLSPARLLCIVLLNCVTKLHESRCPKRNKTRKQLPTDAWDCISQFL